MVLRCEKTGKLFFTSKDAELHGEETGLSDFAQVSPEEKVWVCVETGKVCYNQMQMDLHKKRVPEAQSWDEKTVADLRQDWLKKTAESSGDAMETEEDMLLRAAGKAPKGKGKAKPAGPPVVTKETVEQLVEMGFSELRAQKALVKTSNGGIEGAINWLTEHLEDADIDDPIEGEFEVKTQEEIGQATAEAMAGTSGLSAEEKKAKLDEMLAKARAKKLGTSVEEEKQKEKARREGGKMMVQSKRELEEQQRKRDMEARKREKREFELERQKLREKLEADRQEKIKAGLLKPSAPKPEAAAQPEAAVPARPPEPPAAERKEVAAAARNYEEEVLSVEAAREKLAGLSESKSKPALEMMGKMLANVAKAPSEEKYRKVRLSNPKIAEGLVYVPGARQFLVAIGWQLVETEFLQLPLAADPAAQAAAQQAALAELVSACAAAVEARRLAELEARKKEAAERAAKAKREKEEMRAAMARDRAEVASRGPAQASVARRLPTESGGTMTSAIFQEQEEAEARRNAQ